MHAVWHASTLAQSIEGMPKQLVPRAYFAKGNYFALKGRSPFKHLVYPMPEAAGLGIHATPDLGGAVRFGPDVEWIDTIDYAVDEARMPLFEVSIRHYWPDLPADALAPAYAGIRPKISAPGEPATDFVNSRPQRSRRRRLVELVWHRVTWPHSIAGARRRTSKENCYRRAPLMTASSRPVLRMAAGAGLR